MKDQPSSGRTTRVRDLFSQARDLPAGPERQAFLDQACAQDACLRAEVKSLLQADATAADFLNANGAGSPVEALSEVPGTMIGRYRVLELLGEGGFGEVYRAEQTEPVKREVALKIVKLGMDTKEVLARFQAERQALALMDHPNIARVFDAGATDKGRPYFVMELASGLPITDYCDRKRLSLPERLRLFQSVCSAVQHAHQKGIIHRDLKPSNIVVAEQDGAPVPKIIDFGIAKSLLGRLTDRTLVTERELMLGTPAYMSPEQVEVASEDLDTRTDVYSLGVLLYELVSGTTPFESDMLRKAAFAEVQRILREVEPPKPSTRFESLGSRATAIAERRAIEPRTLGRTLRGDLDWIVIKAIEKDRSRRYESAAELGREIVRYLGNEPVQAGPPTLVYEFSKFAKRRRREVVAGGAVALTIIVASIISLAMAIQAGKASQVAEKQKAEAQTEAERLGVALDTIRHALGGESNWQSPGKTYTVEDLLDRIAADLPQRAEERPYVQAELHDILARAYNGMELTDKSLIHHRKAAELRKRLFGDLDWRYAESRSQEAWLTYTVKGEVLEDDGQRERTLVQEEVFPIFDDLVRIARITGDPNRIAGSLSERAYFHRRLGRIEEAVQDLDEALAVAAPTAGLYNQQGRNLAELKRFAEAEQSFKAALGMYDDSDSDNVWRAGIEYHLAAAICAQQERFQEAMVVARKSLDVNIWAGTKGVMDGWRQILRIALAQAASAMMSGASKEEALATYRQCLADYPDMAIHPQRKQELALLCAWSGDLPGYEPACPQLKECYTVSEPFWDRFYITWAHCLQPTTPHPAEELVALVDGLQPEDSLERRPASLLVRGAARYRLGLYSEAETLLGELNALEAEPNWDFSPSYGWFFLAMTLEKQANHGSALQAYERGRALMKDDLSSSDGLQPWWTRVMAMEVIDREARALLGAE